MAKKKSDLEIDCNEYGHLARRARLAIEEGLAAQAIMHSVQSFRHVSGMMQYERRYNSRDFQSVETIDLVLRFAPLMFDTFALDELGRLLKRERSIDRFASDDLAARLGEARANLRTASRVWKYVREVGQEERDLWRTGIRAVSPRWSEFVDAWCQLGAMRWDGMGGGQTAMLVTRMDAHTGAQCSACGTIARGKRILFMEPRTCPGCANRANFVVLE